MLNFLSILCTSMISFSLINNLSFSANQLIEKQLIERQDNEISFDFSLIDNREGVYNYCPSVLVEEDTIGIFYCANTESYIIKDSIYYRELKEDYVPKEILSPTENNWDSVHVCDPSVIEGNWIYNGLSYKYLMAYLGCNTLDNQKNQIGLAVSNKKDSDWIKIGNEPLITHNYNSEKGKYFQWGVGQPSLINIGKGYVLLFYTEGTYSLTSTKCALYNLSNLNDIKKLKIITVSNKGLLKEDNISEDFLSNGDFALKDNILYVVCDVHPFGNGILGNIPNIQKVYSMKIDGFLLEQISNKEWNLEYEINENQKNHNSGLVRNPYGYLYEKAVIETTSTELDTFLNSLWTYRLKYINFENN